MKIKLFSFFLLLVTTTFMFAVLEVCIRYFLPKYYWEFRDATMDWRIDSELGWINRPNLNLKFITTDKEKLSWFRTNEDGLITDLPRNRELKGITRIIIFGDSAVVGRSVSQDETVAVQLQKILYLKGIRAEVINAGVQGYSTDQVLLFMQRIIPLYNPDIVLYCVCNNDFLGIESNEMYGVSKPKFYIKNNKLHEVHPNTSGNTISRLEGKSFHKWIQYSALYRLVRPKIAIVRAKLKSWDKKNMVGASLSHYYYDKHSFEEIDWQLFTLLVKSMKEFSDSYRAKFFFYSHPHLEEVWDPYIQSVSKELNIPVNSYNRYAIETHLQEIAGNNLILFCPMIDYFIKNIGRGPFHLLPRDPHCNSIGYKVTSEMLADFLIRKEFIPTVS